MSDKPRSFPLPLSSVTDKGVRKAPVIAPVATPQTATQNAARHLPPGGAYAGSGACSLTPAFERGVDTRETFCGAGAVISRSITGGRGRRGA